MFFKELANPIESRIYLVNYIVLVLILSINGALLFGRFRPLSCTFSEAPGVVVGGQYYHRYFSFLTPLA